MRLRILLPALALAACTGQPAGDSAAATLNAAPPAAAQPAHSVQRPGQGGPLVAVAAGRGGACDYRWGGHRVAEAALIDRAVVYLKRAVDRLGGAERLTEDNMPAVDFQLADEVPYRCVRAALDAMARSGYARFRIDNPGPGAAAWAQPLRFEFELNEAAPPPVDPVRNRLGLTARETPSWNGIPIDRVTLRQYCDLTQQMNPVPWIILDLPDPAPYRQLRPLLTILWRCHAARIQARGGPSFHVSEGPGR
jgi:hypothetical protein